MTKDKGSVFHMRVQQYSNEKIFGQGFHHVLHRKEFKSFKNLCFLNITRFKNLDITATENLTAVNDFTVSRVSM